MVCVLTAGVCVPTTGVCVPTAGVCVPTAGVCVRCNKWFNARGSFYLKLVLKRAASFI